MSTLLLLLLVWGLPLLAQAATLNVSTPAQLTSALASAVAGDEIVLANGTYSGEFTVNGNSGTAAQPITIRAATRHQAILVGTNACDRFQEGLIVQRPYWVIKDLTFRDHGRAISVYANNVEIAHNVIDHFREEGIRVDGSGAVGSRVQYAYIHHNVIANGDACSGDAPGLYLVGNTDNSTVQDNIIVGTGDNGYQYGAKFGYGLFIANNSDDNLIQGNLLLGNGGKGVLRILSDGTSSTTADRNIVRDNAFLFGEGGVASDDCNDDSNQFINNFVYGQYHSTWSTKGNLDGSKGHHVVRHNTFVVTPLSRAGAAVGPGGCPEQVRNYKIANTIQDNVFYSAEALNAGSGEHYLWLVVNQGSSPSSILLGNHNLFWGPGATSTWTAGYTLGAQDIHATGSVPSFVNTAQGNYTLAPGSPGTNAASDGTNMGMAWNASLKQQWVANAFALASQQNTGLTGATATSFAVDAARSYQVWFYIPTSPCAQSAESFTVEGTAGLVRDITGLTTGGDWVQPGGPARYITLGRHRATDGTLNVAWQHTNCVERVLIRALPTAAEAYQWITPTVLEPVKAFPTAEGFGAQTIGGRGGQVLYVTNLNDSGAGSLRNALMQTFPRTILFKVGGTIALQSDILLGAGQSYVTLAGQTAPGGGIQLKHYPLILGAGFQHGIIRHIRSRPGTERIPVDGGGQPSYPAGSASDSLGVNGATFGPYVSNVILDHVSLQWGVDENLDASYGVTDLTVQWSLLAEGSIWGHDSSPYVDHSMGAILARYGGPAGAPLGRLSLHHNVFAQNVGRNPRIGLNAPTRTNEFLIDFRNNVVAQWGGAQGPMEIGFVQADEVTPVPLSFGTLAELNIVNNYFQQGNCTYGCSAEWPGTIGYVQGPAKIYLAGNGTSDYCPSGCDAAHWNVAFVDGNDNLFDSYAPASTYRSTTEFSVPAVATTPLASVKSTVLASVGATKPARDSLDARLVTEVTNNTGTIGPLNHQQQVTTPDYPVLASGTAPTDTDNDGMPDTWETARGLNPNSAADGPAISANGYTNLENYLNELAGDAPPVEVPTTLELRFPLNEGTGTVATDATGHGHTGTVSGGTTWGAGRIGAGALTCHGSTGQIQVPGLLGTPAAITLAAWVRLAVVPSQTMEVLSLGDAVAMRVNPSPPEYMAFFYNGSSWNNLTYATALDTNWHHLVYTTQAGSQALYVDGALRASGLVGTGPAYTGVGSNTMVCTHGNGQTSFRLNGTVDDVRVYHGALSAAEVAALYAWSDTPPTLAITAPTSSPTYATATTPLTTLAGTASDDTALAPVTWACPSCTPASGTAAGTSAWSLPGLTLTPGLNVITVRVVDPENQAAQDTLTVTYTPTAEPSPTPCPPKRLIPALSMGGAAR